MSRAVAIQMGSRMLYRLLYVETSSQRAWLGELWPGIVRNAGICLPPWDSAEVDLSCRSLPEKIKIHHTVCCFQYSISNLEGSRVVWAFWNPTLWFEINLCSDQERDARSHPQPGICPPRLSSVCPCSKQTYQQSVFLAFSVKSILFFNLSLSQPLFVQMLWW